MYRVMLSSTTLAGLKVQAQGFIDEMNGQQIVPQNESQEDDDIAQEELAAEAPAFTPPNPFQDTVARQQTKSPVQESGDKMGVDASGLPWDERIHASSFAKTKDGHWRTRRGVEDSQIKAVEAELRARMGIPTVTPVLAPIAPVIPIAPVAASVPTPLPPAPAPVTFAHTLQTFKAQLIPTLAELVKQGKLDQPYIEQLQKHYNVDGIWKLNDQQLGELFNLFVGHGLLTQVG